MFCLFKVPQARFSACVAALTSPALFLAVGVASARAGTITTFAGNGTYTYGGDGGPATAAALFEPHGLGLGPNGSMYITTWMDARVRHVLPNGTMTTFAGTGENDYDPAGGPATSCRLALPTSVVVDPRSGDVYISDDYRIVKVVANGTTVAVAGRYAQQGADDDGMPATAAALYSPYGLAINPAGHVVFTEDQHHRVRIVVANGTLWTIAGMGAQGYRGDGGPATAAQLYLPLDVAYDSAGTLYIADFGNNRVRKVNATTGVITTFAGNGSSAFGPDGVPATSTSVMRPSGVSAASAASSSLRRTTSACVRCSQMGPSPRSQEPATQDTAVIAGPRRPPPSTRRHASSRMSTAMCSSSTDIITACAR